MPSTDLPSFLLERIAEDERGARDSSWRDAEWEVADRPARWGDDPAETVLAAGKPVAELNEPGCALAAEHIARWDPARVLAECEAKRRIVAECSPRPYSRITDGALGPILRLLALPYADHPDYDEAWRP